MWTPGTGLGTDQATVLPFDLTNRTIGSGDLVFSEARAVNGDGTTIVGWSEIDCSPSTCGLPIQFDALVWLPAGPGWWSGFKLRTVSSSFNAAGARGVSEDGGNVVGWTAGSSLSLGSTRFSGVQATLWTRNGPDPTTWTPLRLGSFGGDYSVANGVAVDGSGNRIVVGWGGSIGTCGGGNTCLISRGSDDAFNVLDFFNFAVRAGYWTVPPGAVTAPAPTPLIQLVTGRSAATAISADASTIVGWADSQANSSNPLPEAVLWKNTGSGFATSNPQPLGIFDQPADIAISGIDPLGSVALAVSEKGDAVVGYEAFGPFPSIPYFTLAFVWTSGFANGQGKYLGDALKQAGVNLGNWVLYTATGVRSTADSFIVVGTGCATGALLSSCAGDPGYIVRLAKQSPIPTPTPTPTPEPTPTPSGITTPTEQIESFTEITNAALAVSTNVGLTLTGLNQMAENHRCIRPQDGPEGNWCFFTFGTGGLFDDDDVVDGAQFVGDVGLAHYFTPVTSVGASIGAGVVDTDLNLDGGYHETELHVGGYAAHIPDTGLRLFGAGLWGDLSDIDISRGYLNGVAITHSSGNTNGNGWGSLGRVGYGFHAGGQTLLTPFAQVTYTDAHFDGYSESDGPFPTTFHDIDTNTTVGRAGVLEETDLSATLRVFGQAAWVHVFDSETPVVKGAVLDIFELSADASAGLDDWAEFTTGARMQVSQKGVLSLSGTAATEFDSFFSLNGRVGYSQIF